VIVDIHTHLMWYPEHLSEEYATAALEAKLVKLRNSGGLANDANLNLHSYDSRPEDHWAIFSEQVDRVVVFGLQARHAGIFVPNELVAEYAAAHPGRVVGWASVDPTDPACVAQLEHAVRELGLRGLKLGPVYQHFDPTDHAYFPLWAACVELGIPTIWHQGTTFPRNAPLKWANPLQLEEIALAFPELVMIVAHLGHPWEVETIVMIRKQPNMYADVSAIHYRPWRMWQALVTAQEYGVEHKLLFGSDYPSGRPSDVIAGLRAVNDIVEGSRLPRVRDEMVERIINHNHSALPFEWE
jgi:predicted TIM-barrel fold metal-dependent hydrolase